MFHQTALVFRPSSSCTSTCSTFVQPRPPSSSGVVAAVQPARRAPGRARGGAASAPQPAARQLGLHLERDQHLVHVGGRPLAQLTLRRCQCEVHASSSSRRCSGSSSGSSGRSAGTSRYCSAAPPPAAQPPRSPSAGLLQPPAAVAQVGEPALDGAGRDQPIDPPLLRPQRRPARSPPAAPAPHARPRGSGTASGRRRRISLTTRRCPARPRAAGRGRCSTARSFGSSTPRS